MTRVLSRILVTTDFSDLSATAFAHAAALAEEFGAQIYALHVIEPAPFAAGMEAVPLVQPPSLEHATKRKELDNFLRGIMPGNLAVVALLREGKPVPEILAAAKEHRVDLIVISTHGRGFMGHLLLGSVAEQVIRQAHCPVLAVPANRAQQARSALGSHPSDGPRH